MWIGTNGGLNRYDGSSFIQCGILSHPALSNSVITSLMQDNDGYIWIGTENGITWSISCYGIRRFNNTAKRFDAWLKNKYAVPGPNLHLRSSYCADDDGNIW